MAETTDNWARSTLAVQALHLINEASGAIVPGIEPSSTFARGEDYALLGDASYARYSNPTTKIVEQVLSALEGGAAALLFNAGMAATTCVFETVRAGQHIVAPQIMYHGGQDWLRRISETRNIELTLFDQTKAGALEQAVRSGQTAIVWVESP